MSAIALSSWELHLALLVLVGCSSGSAGHQEIQDGGADADVDMGLDFAAICDGSDRLRFAAYVMGTGVLSDAVSKLQTIGGRYLYVDGKCHYWALDALVHHETREGELTDAQAQLLAADYQYGRWSDIEGAWSGGGIHGDWLIVHDTRAGFACYFGCEAAPEVIRSITDREMLLGWIDQLYAQGTPLDGPIRLTFEEWGEIGTPYGDDFAINPSPWPLQEPPSSLASWNYEGISRIYGDNPLGGHLVVDGDALKGLREARAAKLESDYPPWLALGPVEGGYATIQLRDVIPLEDADGLIPEPSIPARDGATRP